jgi:hypothetical protein
MSSIAASPPKWKSIAKPRSLGSFIQSPAGVTAVLGAFVTALGWLVAPMVTQGLQNHGKRLEVRTAIATDMSKSFTMAVGAGQRVASGLIYGTTGDRDRNAAAVQAAYNTGLGQWQVDGGRIGAELFARYTGNDIVRQWKLYRLNVTRFYRLSALIPGDERRSFVRDVRLYFKDMRSVPWASSAVPGKRTVVNWKALKQNRKFRKSAAFRRTYDKVSAAFLSLGDAFVEQTLKLHPEV